MSDSEKYRDLLNHESSSMNDELAEFISKSAGAKIPAGRGKEDIWNQIDSQTVNREKSSIRIWPLIGIAASLLIATFVFVFFFNSTSAIIDIRTGLAESKAVKLPDGSQVTLNANSQISYSEDWNRTLSLEGEGFFEVVKGGKFQVQTSVGVVEVLGTSFNIFVRDSIFEVACKTGKVNVKIPSKSFDQSLTPGDLVRLESDTVRQTKRTTELVGKWKLGEFYFNEQRLSNVLQEMERQFNVSLVVADSSNYEFSGYFTNKNIEKALEMVCLPLGLTYEKTGAKAYAIRELE
ncbi:FecR family protein [Ekhidna sp.]